MLPDSKRLLVSTLSSVFLPALSRWEPTEHLSVHTEGSNQKMVGEETAQYKQEGMYCIVLS